MARCLSRYTRYYPAVRIDYNINQKLRLDFSLEETKVSQPGAAPLHFFPRSADFANQAGSFKSNNYITSLGLNWTITPNLINQLRGGYYYNAFWYAQGVQSTWDTIPQVTWPICTSSHTNCSGQAFNLPVSTYYPIINIASDNAAWVPQSSHHHLWLRLLSRAGPLLESLPTEFPTSH